MQKFTLSICSVCALIVLGLSSCKDDDEPFVKPKLSVATETVTIAEGGGTAEVGIVLDKAAPTDITVEYSLGGTAVSPADYSIVGTEGEIDIPQGQTSATIKISIVNDVTYEGNETIEIELQDVNSDDIEITNDDEAVVTITEDDAQVELTMATATVDINEEDGELIVEVTLSQAAVQEITLNYTLTGTALDTVFAATQEPEPIPVQYWDYYIDTENSGQLVIPQGATKGEISVQILTDFQFEDPETIVITLDNATGATIGTNKVTTINVEQQNGKIIALVWDDAYTDVDMDMFLWIGDDVSDLFFAASSTNPSVTERVEALIIPDNIDGVAFGTSYTYYEGTADPMEFEAHFADFVDGTVEPLPDRDVYPGIYTVANINRWDEDGAAAPAIVQTFEKNAGVFENVTDPIVAPATGSRTVTVALPQGVRKLKTSLSKSLRRFK
jgi:hypothetical protein